MQRENGRWVVTQLRVFPDSPDLDLERLLDQTQFWIEVGLDDWAAESARTLAHLAQRRPRQQAPGPVPVGGLTARHLRQIPFTSVGGMFAGRFAKQFGTLYRAQKRLGRGEARLARIAHLYVQALNRGSRSQNLDVARQLGLAESQVRDAIFLARRKGLLSATRQQGIPGGELTPRAVELLQRAGDEIAQRDRTESSVTDHGFREDGRSLEREGTHDAFRRHCFQLLREVGSGAGRSRDGQERARGRGSAHNRGSRSPKRR